MNVCVSVRGQRKPARRKPLGAAIATAATDTFYVSKFKGFYGFSSGEITTAAVTSPLLCKALRPAASLPACKACKTRVGELQKH